MIHEDTLALQRLWASHEAANQLTQERSRLLERVREAETEKTRAEEELAAARDDLNRLKDGERSIQRRLHTYHKRVKTTRELIESGHAVDYQVARQQLDSCLEIVDALETEALETMEAIDAAESRIATAEERLTEATGTVEDVHRARETGLPRIDQELQRLKEERTRLREDIPAAHLERFDRLVARGRSAVATLQGTTCSACNFNSPPQVVIEINRGSRVHACRNCGRFLVPSE